MWPCTALQVEQLQGVLSVKEAQLAKALAEIKDLKSSGARPASAMLSAVRRNRRGCSRYAI